MSKFPHTNVAYQLAVEYCTLQRIKDYQQSYFAKQSNVSPKVDTELLYKNARNSFHAMADEFKEIMKGDNSYLKKEIVEKIKIYISHENIVHFRVQATMLIKDFNTSLGTEVILRNVSLTDYFKDGFIVTHDFISTAEYLLKKYIDPSLTFPISSHNESTPRPKSITVKKINTTLTVGQLAYLFRLLYDNDFTHVDSLSDLSKFIALHFKNKRTGDIDINNLRNLLSTPHKSDADKIASWLKNFMIKASNFEVKSQK